MARRRVFKPVHFFSTAFFILCAAYIMIAVALEGGQRWVFIVSLTGYSAFAFVLFLCIYLLAVFRNSRGKQQRRAEHPLTGSRYYSVFYNTSPFLGALAGCFAAITAQNLWAYFLIVATGTFWATILVWIILDPALWIIEMVLPSSRTHRKDRLASARAVRLRNQAEKERLLAEVQYQDQIKGKYWRAILTPLAENLAALLAENDRQDVREAKAVDIGLNAWRMGGLNCMRRLHSMAMDIYTRKCRKIQTVDFISKWWDGIGTWHSK